MNPNRHPALRSGLALGLAAASALLGACLGQSDAAPPHGAAAAADPAARTYPQADVAVAKNVAVPEHIVVTGTIEPLDRSELVPDISGKVVEIMVDRGSKVAAGDPLVRLDTRAAALSEREARANLAALKAQQRLADDTCRRSKELLDKGAVTRAEYDRDMAQCAQARENVSAAAARLGKAGQTLEDGVIRAPFAGTIAERWVSLGEWASPQGRLFTLVDDRALHADLALSEAAALHAVLGAPVDLHPVADRARRVRGTISRVGVEIDPKTRSLLVEVALPASDAATSVLKAGMFVEARLVVGERALPAVPKSAIVKRGATWRIFAAIGGRLEERVVQLGPDTEDGRATIASGLTADEAYATAVGDQTSDGMSVEAAPGSEGSAPRLSE